MVEALWCAGMLWRKTGRNSQIENTKIGTRRYRVVSAYIHIVASLDLRAPERKAGSGGQGKRCAK